MKTEIIRDIKTGAKLFKAISDMNRIRILKMLLCCPMCVCEITFVMNLAPSTVSKHLSILRDAGLIQDKKEGKWVNYKLNENATSEIKKVLSIVKEIGNDDSLIKRDLRLLQKADRSKICKL